MWRSLPEKRRMVEQVIPEVVAVGLASHIEMAEDAIGTAMGVLDRLPPNARASMQRDLGGSPIRVGVPEWGGGSFWARDWSEYSLKRLHVRGWDGWAFRAGDGCWIGLHRPSLTFGNLWFKPG